MSRHGLRLDAHFCLKNLPLLLLEPLLVLLRSVILALLSAEISLQLLQLLLLEHLLCLGPHHTQLFVLLHFELVKIGVFGELLYQS